MTPHAALIELLARLGANDGAAVLVGEHELSQWPGAAVSAMKAQRLLTKARSASSAVCPECEEECVMPVHVLPSTQGSPSALIVCDKRSDVSRVAVSLDRLQQWQCTTDSVCRFVAATLGLRHSDKRHPASADFLEIGMATGDKRSQMLCLHIDGELTLVAGGTKVPLAEFIAYDKDAYSVDGSMICLLVDAATTADSRYTPSIAKRESRKLETQAMYKDWQKAYRDLRKTHKDKSETWCSQQIAKMTIAKGRNASTIKKNMLS